MITYIKNKMFSNENNKTIINNTLGAFLVKGCSLIISLLTMPAYIRYFDNQEVLGLWFTILSVLSWVLTFDLGIGNGLRNHLVMALVDKDQLKIKKYISSAYVVISIVVLVAICFSTVIFRYINWNVFFNIPYDVVSKEVLSVTVLIVFYGILLQFLFKLINSILYALQKSALTNLLQLISSILILAYVLFSKSGSLSSNLITLAVFHGLAVNIPLLFATVLVFSKNLKGFRPKIKYFEKSCAKDVLKLGGAFFWVQIMYLVIVTTNEFLITWLAGPAMVVEYQIYNRIFTLIGTIFILALTPIWSAVTKAYAERNFEWIKKLYRVLKLMALAAVLGQFGVIVFLQNGINVWLGENSIEVNYFYAVIFAFYGSIFVWNAVISSIANGLGELRTQSIFYTLGAVLKIPLAIFLVNVLNSWIGILIAYIFAMSLYCIVQPIWINRLLRRKEMGE